MEEPKRVTTSIKIDPEIWKEAKIEAIHRDIDLSELVENAIKKEIKKR
jgi:post-segregation antitoxin (ccd killing protein)